MAQCVECGTIREIQRGELPQGEPPLCDRCFSIMIPKKTKPKKLK